MERAKSAASPILTLDAVIGREFFFHEFWKSSTSHIALKRKGQLNEENRKIEEELHTKKARLDEVGKYYRVF